MIDYQVSYAESPSEDYSVFSSGLTSLSETLTGLTPGITYRIVVQARNLVGLSPYSDFVDILAA